MTRMRRATVAVLVLLGLSAPALAQLSPPNEAGVAMGHLHYYVRDVEANQRFWESLGGEVSSFGQSVVVKFPDVLVFLSEGEPEGGTEGSIVNHMAFRVQSLDTIAGAGFEFDPPPSGVTNVFSPEGERIELFDDTATNLTFTLDDDEDGAADTLASRHNRPLDLPIIAHHLHLYLVEDADAVQEAQRWYARMFGGAPGTRWRYDAVDLPGINLNFSYNADAGGAPTRGRMLDHIGFEITDLEAFCQRLEAQGVTLDVPYTLHSSGIGYAFLTDPWGVYIELTEGLRQLY
jgi:catechol 2,3-dioxygenase-like lactoylglutathione lyase family enzyme